MFLTHLVHNKLAFRECMPTFVIDLARNNELHGTSQEQVKIKNIWHFIWADEGVGRTHAACSGYST